MKKKILIVAVCCIFILISGTYKQNEVMALEDKIDNLTNEIENLQYKIDYLEDKLDNISYKLDNYASDIIYKLNDL